MNSSHHQRLQKGSAVFATSDYHGLAAGEVYRFWLSVPNTSKVLLVSFGGSKKNPSATLVKISASAFFHGIERGTIICQLEAPVLPPHLCNWDQEWKDAEDLDRYLNKPNNQKIIEDRLTKIAPLLSKKLEIVANEYPIRYIRDYAANHKLHPQRLRLWFLSYEIFGNAAVLLPRTVHNGRWDRDRDENGLPYGRKISVFGCKTRRLTKQDHDFIEKGFREFREECKYLVSIYRRTLLAYFDCEAKEIRPGSWRLESRSGKPIPSQSQFESHLCNAVGRTAIRKARIGEHKYRRSIARQLGKFTEDVSELMEKLELDAYCVSARPAGYLDGTPLLAVWVVVIRDVASGMIVGIGFSYGGEKEEAYRAALFSAACPKKIFCKMFGLDIRSEDWPSIGLSDRIITDRGPGSKRAPLAIGDLSDEILLDYGIHELTPSGFGQSKAIVEASNPRQPLFEGAELGEFSKLSLLGLAQEAINRVITFNHQSDASGHMTPEMHDDRVMQTPRGVWDWMTTRGRNAARTIPTTNAIKALLRKIKISVDKSGFEFQKQRYVTDSEIANKYQEAPASKRKRYLDGYLLPFCVKQIWVEIGGKPIQLDAELNVLDDDTQLYQTVDGQEARKQLINAGRRERDVSATAFWVHQQQNFMESKGQALSQPTTLRKARVKRKSTKNTSDSKDLQKGRDWF